MFYNARWYDPSLGRFAQADTMIPSQQGVQAWDRYAYVNNSPVNYTDPSGHDIQCPENGDCYETCDYNCGSSDGNGGNGGGDNDGGDSSGSENISDLPRDERDDDLCLIHSCLINTPPPSYCGNGPNGFYDVFDCGANLTQDLALIVDLPFAATELIFIGVGCLGGWKGCLAGAKVGQIWFNGIGANNLEAGLSGISAVSSILADISDDFQIGESTFTALATAGVGSRSKDPIIDFIIDGYGSGYNHEVFNGIYSFFTSDPLLKR